MKHDHMGTLTVSAAGIKDRLPYILIPLVALLAIFPLITNGCSCGHDFDFHIVNWFEAAHQLAHGHYPQWAATPAWNAGEPRFVFYPPLSWLIGALLGALMPWTWTPIAYTWLALAAAGLALYASARDLNASPNAALFAAVIYTVNPYTLFTAYERTAYAELLAAAWLPLLLAAILRDRPTVPRIAVPVALLWLTNAPAAVMGCYALALVAIIRLVTTPGSPSFVKRKMGNEKFQLATTTLTGTFLGLGLAAVYILPAAYERPWIQVKMAILPGLTFAENFLFHHTTDPDHDHVLRTASIVAVLTIALTAIALFAAIQKTTHRPRLLALAILTATIAFLLTPPSASLWRHTPELSFLQFPWRLVAVIAAIFGLALAHLPAIANRRTLALLAFLFATAFTRPAFRAFQQLCYPEDTVAERLAVFHSDDPGTDPTDEYTPTRADNDTLAHDNPPWWLADRANAPTPASASQQPGPAPRSLDLNLDSPQTLVLNLRQYPAWQITVNGAPANLASRKDGLIALQLPTGPTHIRIHWHNGADRIIAILISVLALALLLLLWRRDSRSTINEQRATNN
jgi:hypothetical protein